ncbi:MAG: acyl CoA:acetate/3-ketoacid CoA transferase [Sulfobacillus benefaciens]|uniref:Acyl CoA:acetate/3-ketoacid CoA transferase n=1 Tax=Sulfobacillus benefaciens TaxID=453960 RepID=A0A2T2X7Z9_9FIRM|nr:MAG: acyl CoA:acetate/3-ketoacid CoA transferase [Sulfobacillus benefaciens]
MVRFVEPMEIAHAINDGDTILTVGMTLVGAAEAILSAIEARFLAEGHPQHLTLLHGSGQSDRVGGIQHLAHEGLVERIIGSHWGLAPQWMNLIASDTVLAYCFPQGQFTHWLRSVASGLSGHLTQIGLGTFIDPRIDGGKMNRRTQGAPDLIHHVTLQGHEYLWLDQIPLDWVIVRGTAADSIGNISAEQEAMKLELLPAVFAGRRYNAAITVQVKDVVSRGTIPPRQVEIPGAHVDYVVVAGNPEKMHRQTASWTYDAAYSNEGWRPTLEGVATPSLDVRRVIGRRALFELTPGALVNMGTGIPNDVIGPEVLREGADEWVTLTVESGVYGGRPVGGVDFGIAQHPDALIEHPYQFDFYNGHGVDVTFMGFGEVDARGHVNATKLGDRATGAGGFIDITQPAKTVVFCGTFTAQGLDVDIKHRQLRVVTEGQVMKWVSRVQQISFNGSRALAQGQRVVVITERGVFTLTATGWELKEIAPGVDLQRDILDQMAFEPQIATPLAEMDARIFSEERLNLQAFLRQLENDAESEVRT